MAAQAYIPGAALSYDPNMPEPTEADYVNAFQSSNATRGFRASLLSHDANAAAMEYWRARQAGNEQLAAQRGLAAQALSQRAAVNSPRVQSVGDINGLGDAGDYVAGVMGQIPVSVIPPVAMGLAGGMIGRRLGPLGTRLGSTAGVVAGTALPESDAAAMQQFQAEQGAAPAMSPDDAITSFNRQGLAMGAVDGLLGPASGAVRSVLGQGVRVAAHDIAPGLFRRVGTDMLREGGQEAVQERIAQGFESNRNANRDTSGDNMRLLDAGVAGGIMGGPFGVAGHAGDVVHSALNFSADMARQGGAAGYDAAQRGGRAALDAAPGARDAVSVAVGRAIDKMPQSRDEWVEALGQGASKVQGATDDALVRVILKGYHPDLDTLMKSQKGMDQRGMEADDLEKHSSAVRLAESVLTIDDAPETVRSAADGYLKGSRTQDSYRQFKHALTEWQVEEQTRDALRSFGKSVGDRALKAADKGLDKVAGKDERQNAQTPRTPLSPFDTVVFESMRKAMGIKPGSQLDADVAEASRDIQKYILSEFREPGDKHGQVWVPSELQRILKDPATTITDITDLMVREGKIKQDVAEANLQELLAELRAEGLHKKSSAEIVRSTLVPTAEQKYKITPKDHAGIVQAITDSVNTGKFNEPLLDELFGRNKNAVVEAIGARSAQLKKYSRGQESGGERKEASTQDDEAYHGGDESDESVRDDEGRPVIPDMEEPTVKWHGYNRDKPYKANGLIVTKAGEQIGTHDAHATNKSGDLETKNSSVVKRQGYIDYLKEMHGEEDPVGLSQAINAFVAEHQHELTREELAHRDVALNKKYFMLREENKGDKADTVDIPPGEFGSVTGKSPDDGGSNSWGLVAGKDNKYATVDNGRIWFRRSDGVLFNTSVAKIIDRIKAAKWTSEVTEATGPLQSHDMLMAGISSMLHSGWDERQPDGSTKRHYALEAVGVLHAPGKNTDIEWLGHGKNLPDTLKIFDHSVGSMRAERIKTHVEKMVRELKDALGKTNDLRDAEAIRTALADTKDVKQLQRVYDKVTSKAEAGRNNGFALQGLNYRPGTKPGTDKISYPSSHTTADYKKDYRSGSNWDARDDAAIALEAAEKEQRRLIEVERAGRELATKRPTSDNMAALARMRKEMRAAKQRVEELTLAAQMASVRGGGEVGTANTAKERYTKSLDTANHGPEGQGSVGRMDTVGVDSNGKLVRGQSKSQHGTPPDKLGDRLRSLPPLEIQSKADNGPRVYQEETGAPLHPRDNSTQHLRELEKVDRNAERKNSKSFVVAPEQAAAKRAVRGNLEEGKLAGGKESAGTVQPTVRGASPNEAAIAKLEAILSVPEKFPGAHASAAEQLRKLAKGESAGQQGGVELPKTSPFTAKDQVKSDKATKFIGQGSARSSTESYAKAWGNRANAGKYSAADRVFLSVEGDRNGRKSFDRAELQKALDAGATIITDDMANRTRSYNVGEREAAQYLTVHGYEESKPGEWTQVRRQNAQVTNLADKRWERTKAKVESELSKLSEEDYDALQNDILQRDPNSKSLIPSVLKEHFNEWLSEYRSERETLMAPENQRETEIKFLQELIDNGPDDSSPHDVAMAEMILKNGGLAPERRSSQRPSEGQSTHEEQMKVIADGVRRLGPDFKAAFVSELFGKNAAGERIPISGDWHENIMRVSVYAENPSQIGAHEHMHEFMGRLMKATVESGDKGAERVGMLLARAADSAPVVRQLQRLLIDHPEALKQIENGAPHAVEERLAYMFQFHQAGLLKLGPETVNTFTKVANFFRRVVGLLSDDQKADAILRAFNEGRMPTADAAAEVLANSIEYRERIIGKFNEAISPVTSRVQRAVGMAANNLEKSDNPFVKEIGRQIKTPTGESGEQSLLEAKDHQFKLWTNRLSATLRDLNPKDLDLAAKYLYRGERSNDAIVNGLIDKIKGEGGLLPKFHDYLREAGVSVWNDKKGRWEPIGKQENYFTRAWDTHYTLEHSDEAIALLHQHHEKELQSILEEAIKETADGKDAGKQTASHSARVDIEQGRFKDRDDALANLTTDDIAQAIVARIINGAGQVSLNENSNEIGFSPFMRSVNRRTLNWLDTSKFTDFMDKDVAKVLTTYLAQGVKRAESTRRFGPGGENLQRAMDKAQDFELDKIVKTKYGVEGASGKARGAISAVKSLGGSAGSFADELAKTINFSNSEAKLDAEGARKLSDEARNKLFPVTKDIMAMEGTLGYDVDPRLRRVQNGLMAYQNMRTMALSGFSQLIDPMGIVIRGGTMSDAFDAYKRGIKEVLASWKGEHTSDEQARIAEEVGTADAHGALAAFGQLYSSLYLGAKFRKANDMLFKVNGMEGFNRGLQISATQAAIGFIKKHSLTPGKHSEAYLAELGLTAADVKASMAGKVEEPVEAGKTRLYRGENPNNKAGGDWFTTDKKYASTYGGLSYLDVTPEDMIAFAQGHHFKQGVREEYVLDPKSKLRDSIKQLSETPSDGNLDYTDPKIQQAIHRWVNGAILRPNAGQRPAWASDPHYAVFWHMKQFAYTFHDTVLKRVVNDLKKYDDLGPAAVLALTYTPIMIAADATKAILLTGKEPSWMAQGLPSMLEHGSMRAGLTGMWQPVTDTAVSGRSWAGLAGPSVEQLTSVFTHPLGESAVQALPGASVINTIHGNAHMFADSDE